jgi:ElaB/YqjD/DUF883 family membrane-anchored ribosome-binding protein
MARKSAASEPQDKLLQEFQTLVGETEKLLQQSASVVGEQGDELRDKLRESIGRARDTLTNAEQALTQRGKAALEATEGYVQSHPWQTIGFSAAIGLLLGLLISRR